MTDIQTIIERKNKSVETRELGRNSKFRGIGPFSKTDTTLSVGDTLGNLTIFHHFSPRLEKIEWYNFG